VQHSGGLTDLIDRANRGDAAAVNELFEATYRELRKAARRRLRGSSRNTLLNTTALVHESYLRLAGAGQLQIKDRVHFLCYAARAMRTIIVDLVRKRLAERRGGVMKHVTLTTQMGDVASAGEEEILHIHGALDNLAELDPRMAQVVEMRYFAGMTEAEIAEALAVTDRTVRRDWEKARLWLAAALQ
jgi:RNA polymerase sigma factor (TIGR02999 family)